MLPRIISPHWTPRRSDLMSVPIRNDLEMPEQWSIRYQVVTLDIYAEPGLLNLGAIPHFLLCAIGTEIPNRLHS
jgi:hypothetical protein